MAFAKLNAMPRARTIRAIDALWRAIGEICDLFSPQECQNYFAASGYGFIGKPDALADDGRLLREHELYSSRVRESLLVRSDHVVVV
jgi:hypothetical protein